MSILRGNSLPVQEVMLKPDAFPIVSESALLKDALESMGCSGLGIVCIVDAQYHLLGIITDGDVRRKLLQVQKPFSAFFVDDALVHANKKPTTTMLGSTLGESISLMGEKQIWDLPVVDQHGGLVGLLHLHPAIQAVLELDE